MELFEDLPSQNTPVTAASLNKLQDNYSTEEIKIGTWIDGRTLYRKVVNFGALPNATSKRVEHGISNAVFVKAEGICHNDNGSMTLPLPYSEPNSTAWFWITQSYIELKTTDDRSNYNNCYFILYYVKK